MQYAAWVPRRSAVQATGHVVGIPFLSMLQIAAGRAWTRHSSSFPRRAPDSKKSQSKKRPFSATKASSSGAQHAHHNTRPASLPSKSRQYERPGKRVIPNFPKEFIPNYSVSYMSPEHLSEHDSTLEPGRAPPILPDGFNNEPDLPWYDLDMSSYSTTESRDNPATPVRRLPPSSTRKALLNNLIHLAQRRPSPGIPALIDYHALHREVHSTRSYNLLIDLSIRHKSFGIVPSLVRAMSTENIDHNHITTKLLLRWLIHTDRRSEAWQLLEETTSSSGSASAPLPVDYWLEFFHSSRRTPLSNTEFLHLMNISPVKFTEMTTPRVMSVVIRAILRLGKPSYALQLVTTYLSAMPRKVDAVLARQNLKLVHLVVCYGSTEKGISRFFQSRQTLQSLLALHPTLRPTPATLLVLLSQLSRCKRAGSIASRMVEEFKDRWGCEVENAEVRQRVASLALKDVRLRGISPKILQTIEESASSSGSQRDGYEFTGFRYVPHFGPLSGVEERRRWRRLHRLYRRRTRDRGATEKRELQVSKRSRDAAGRQTESG
ncbi:uncharacterized protein EV420DRAFT_1637073 [Desarmillaria tabescens]|uniref:Uncharacterized protein n=1 Tax=Armillaria tabescens TaxID=1929756 RepID=A0AA39NFX2_ARMTA|nr:uncharacterized protein EV420DRAFT_1637073 [Desarmillaria tabescens]KAK0464901.1 hypothetical protein EV420DRAFT_1637073 [Desarmillaria tabescens]